MLILEAVAILRASGIDVDQVDVPATGRVDAWLEIGIDGRTTRFAVEEKSRAPYPNEIDRLVQHNTRRKVPHPLLVVPFVAESVASLLEDAGWSWADLQGNFYLRADGLMLRQWLSSKPPARTRERLPRGSGSTAIIRALIGFGRDEHEEFGATSLADQARVSQPRASQVLHQLHALGLVSRSDQGRWIPDREKLLDRFMSDYAGPSGSELMLYSLDAPSEIAVRATGLAPNNAQIAISADVGPDLISPSRRPDVVIIYVTHELNPADLALVEARGRHDANVLVRMPRDRSVFPSTHLVAEVRDVEVPLADPTQMIWDLHDLGGSDRIVQAGRLREWLLGSL